MIPRYQRITFWVLIALVVVMAVSLFLVRQHDRDRISSLAEDSPIDAPYTSSESVTLVIASDADGSLTPTQRSLAVPTEPNARARALIDQLITTYAAPGSSHPLQGGVAMNEVFLVPLPITGHAVDPNGAGSGDTTPTVPVRAGAAAGAQDATAAAPQNSGGELAIIDLRGQFVGAHPSGVEVETLTINSILGTLHANLPEIEQVRFMVDGQPRETLAGHADLLRTYPVRDMTTGAR